MSGLSVVVPFLNEGYRVRKTVESIIETADTPVEIILLDDQSDDEYDYKAIAYEYGCIYTLNEERLGVGGARCKGVEMATMPNILILDAHMKMLQKNWASMIVKHLTDEPRAVYMSRSRSIGPDWSINSGMNCGGAYFHHGSKYSQNFHDICMPKWCRTPAEDWEKELIEAPLIFGAAYALTRDYWNRLDGLRGLKQYECDEYFLSAKAWLEGGKVYIMNRFITGHFYKTGGANGGQNFGLTNGIKIYNKYVSMKATMPDDVFKEQFYHHERCCPESSWSEAMRMVEENKEEIEDIVKTCKAVYTKSWDDFAEVNRRYLFDKHERNYEFGKHPEAAPFVIAK